MMRSDTTGERLLIPGLGPSAEPRGRLEREEHVFSTHGPIAHETARSLEEELRRRVEGEVRLDAGSRALYATDASNYRQVPIGVVLPRTEADVVETVAACRRHDAPVQRRGARRPHLRRSPHGGRGDLR
jgi:hypothetical protein